MPASSQRHGKRYEADISWGPYCRLPDLTLLLQNSYGVLTRLLHHSNGSCAILRDGSRGSPSFNEGGRRGPAYRPIVFRWYRDGCLAFDDVTYFLMLQEGLQRGKQDSPGGRPCRGSPRPAR